VGPNTTETQGWCGVEVGGCASDSYKGTAGLRCICTGSDVCRHETFQEPVAGNCRVHGRNNKEMLVLGRHSSALQSVNGCTTSQARIHQACQHLPPCDQLQLLCQAVLLHSQVLLLSTRTPQLRDCFKARTPPPHTPHTRPTATVLHTRGPPPLPPKHPHTNTQNHTQT
jgi:hypothetical protein